MKLDNTMVQCFNSCPRKFYWRHVRHLVQRQEGNAALLFGKAIHTGLEKLYLTNDILEACNAFLIDFKDTGDVKRTPTKGLEILEAYHKKFFPEKWEVVKVETPLMFELFKDVLFCGRADLIVRYLGMSYIVEHKTSSNFNWFIPKPNHQISGYVYGGQVLGLNTKGAIVNMLGVLKTKTDFHRSITQRSPSELKEWREYIGDTKIRIDRSLETLRFPKFSHSCYMCGYKVLCNTENPSVLDIIIAKEFVEEKWEPWLLHKT
jgi:CRISPR/Cas system-associated exonuclease Cas4 (RecB family)